MNKDKETQQQVCTDETQEKYIVSVVQDYYGHGERVTFYHRSTTNLEPERHHYTDKPTEAHLFDTERDAQDFIDANKIDGKIHRVTITIETSGIDTTIPTTVKVGSCINIGKDEYMIKKIGNQVVELETVVRDEYGRIVNISELEEISVRKDEAGNNLEMLVDKHGNATDMFIVPKTV